MKSRSSQAITQQDETVQTDDILGSYSSEFELGLFIATLIDELIDAACEVTPQGIKSKSHNYSPGKAMSRSGPAKRRGIYETNIPVLANRNPRARTEVTRNEQMKSVRRYAKAKEGVKSPVKYTKPSKKESRDQWSTKNKLPNGEQSLTIRNQSRSNRDDNIPPSLKKALKSITTSPIPKKDAQLSPQPQQTNFPQRSLPTDNRTSRPSRRTFHISELDSTDSASLDSTILDVPSPQDWEQIGSLGKAMKDDKHPHLSTQQKQILSSLKTRKVKSKKIKKKLWWLFDSEYLDSSSQGESPSISGLKSVLAEPEKQEELRKDYFTGEDFSDSSGPDLNNQIQQTYCNRLSLLKQPYAKSSRKRNIKMSYHPPDFADLFPYAGPILAEANKFLHQNPTMGKIGNNSYWAHPSLNARLLSPLWQKEFTQ
jgi:hypothetical protein